jgi:multidrug efflux system outer membrane protein
MKLGADYKRPELGITVPQNYHHVPADPHSPPPEDPWWHVFNKEELNQVVKEALENNLDIERATARILELRARFIQSRADRFPQLGFQGQVQRQRQSLEALIPTLQGGSAQMQTERHRETIDSFNLALPASFEIDLWGRLARAEEAALAELLRAEENRRTVSHGVVDDTVSLYLQMESLERRIQITEESIDSFRRSLMLVESRYKRGLTSILDVRQARRILTQAEATLPELRQEMGIAQQRLAVLLGRYPESRGNREQPEDYYMSMDPVPPGLPSELLLRRPDIRAAEAALVALNAQIGVAKASRFPRITLTGSFGYTSTELDQLFTPTSQLWNLALGVVQPLFDAGKLRAGQEAAEARYRQGVAEYAKQVLTAFSEVEGALLTRKEQLERRERFLKFLNEARATQEVAESRYGRGLVGYLTVLDAQQTRFVAEQNLVQVELAIYTNRVNLHRALGGGWAELEPQVRQGS